MEPFSLTPDQKTAIAEIISAVAMGGRHVLTGYAGSGKTTLMQELAQWAKSQHQTIIFTAPTHKAVAVLAGKMREAGQNYVACMTIHALLGLTAKVEDDRIVFVRKGSGKPIPADIVVIDECSMLDAELMELIRIHLSHQFVLFVGDPAQLPPVGERESQSFSEPSRSHLETIVRQRADNPILMATDIIRRSQGGLMDWSWRQRMSIPPYGVFIPENPLHWMKKAFLSDEFESNTDTFRYVCWTNARVHKINQHIRNWKYGTVLPTPFMVGERALCRKAVVQDDSLVMAVNEEATVVQVSFGVFTAQIPRRTILDDWTAQIPAWDLVLRNSLGVEISVQIAQNPKDFAPIEARLVREAATNKRRWKDLHATKQRLGEFQSIYAMTVHTSQGSTFKNVFMDVDDIVRRAKTNLLESQQLLYVAATRPTHALILV